MNILKYLNGSLSREDKEKVDLWLDTSISNREEFSFVQKIYEESPNASHIRLVDEEKSWNDLLEKLEEDNAKVVRIKRSRFLRVVGVAASIMFLYFAFNFFFTKESSYSDYVCVKDIDTIQLVDGTTVVARKGTILKYFTKLKKSDTIRFVQLDGVAIFDVTPNKNLPFVIRAGNAGVSVLGTSFELKTTPNKVEIETFKGLVKFYEWENKANNLLVKTGQKAVFDGSDIVPSHDESFEEESNRMLGKYYKVEYVIDYILNRFETRVSTAPYADIMMEDNVFVDLNQSLEKILLQLDTTSFIKFRKTCRNCYEIGALKSYY